MSIQFSVAALILPASFLVCGLQTRLLLPQISGLNAYLITLFFQLLGR